MSKKLLLLVLCFTVALSRGFAGQQKSSGSRSRSSSSKNSSAKTVHVSSYKKTNGTVVRSYNRRTEDTAKDQSLRN